MATPQGDPFDPDFQPPAAENRAGLRADPRADPPADHRHDTRAASLWPESVRPADGASTQWGMTRFDPAAEGRVERGATMDLCHPALALRLVLLVQGVAAIGTLVAAPPGRWAMLAMVLAVAAYVGMAATLVWLVAMCLLQRHWRGASSGARAGVAMLLGAVLPLLCLLPLWWAGLVEEASLPRMLGVMAAGTALAALVMAWLDMRARLWRPADASARLAELQSRIRPHFLFNALNTALALVRVDPDRAERVLEDLSALFREALADTGASVSLADEVDLAQRYLAIEQVRYGARLQVEWDIDPAAGAARVPPLVLQPLVENAVRHGVEPSARGGRLWVRAAHRRGHAVLLIRNTVPDEPSRPGAGIALANVRERLRLLHDMGAQCEVWREPGHFNARIVVPM